MSTNADISRPTLPAWRLFFPLAAVHAAVMVPLSLLAFYHGAPLGLIDSPAAHGRELLFGFALAVIAGYLLGPLPRRWLLGMALRCCSRGVGAGLAPGAARAAWPMVCSPRCSPGGWYRASWPPRSGATGCLAAAGPAPACSPLPAWPGAWCSTAC